MTHLAAYPAGIAAARTPHPYILLRKYIGPIGPNAAHQGRTHLVGVWGEVVLHQGLGQPSGPLGPIGPKAAPFTRAPEQTGFGVSLAHVVNPALFGPFGPIGPDPPQMLFAFNWLAFLHIHCSSALSCWRSALSAHLLHSPFNILFPRKEKQQHIDLRGR